MFGGSARLGAGAYAARFLLPPGCSLAGVEFAPPCLHPIEPPGGWLPDAVTTRDDLAVTALRAMDREEELPPAASAVVVDADAFRVEAPAGAATAAGLAALTLRAGPGGLRAVALAELPEPGLYTVSALAAPGAGQRWLLDSCRSAALCAGGGVASWRPLASQVFDAGRHWLEVTLGEGASVQAVRLELKKSQPADYVAALERLGFAAGPPGPVSRTTALDAARFVREQRRTVLAAECLQPLPIEQTTTVVAQRTETTPERPGPPGPPVPPLPPLPPEGGPRPVPPPIDTPILPPQEVATPTRPGAGS